MCMSAEYQSIVGNTFTIFNLSSNHHRENEQHIHTDTLYQKIQNHILVQERLDGDKRKKNTTKMLQRETR